MQSFKLILFQLKETTDEKLVVCQNCVGDLQYAETVRRKCLEADEYFRSITPKSSEHLDQSAELVTYDQLDDSDDVVVKAELVDLKNETEDKIDVLDPKNSNLIGKVVESSGQKKK
jgi:hypothetical protein